MDDKVDKRKAGQVGFVLFVATILVIVGTFTVSDGGIFTKVVRYQLLFPSTTGLNEGARVYLSGVGAGHVENVEFAPNIDQPKILVTVTIYKKFADRVRSDSIAWIQSEGLLGDKSICILAGDNSKQALEEGSLIGTVDKAIIEDLIGRGLINSANDLLEHASILVKNINEGNSVISRLLKDAETGDRFIKMIAQLEQASTRLNSILEKIDKGEGSVGMLVNDPSTALSLQDLFLGVNESGLLKNLVRRAERDGRDLRIDQRKMQEQMQAETDKVLQGLRESTHE